MYIITVKIFQTQYMLELKLLILQIVALTQKRKIKNGAKHI